MEKYDVIFIGGGPAGYVGAIRAAQLGMKVACVEKRKGLGGTCLNVGCIPSKALLDSSEHFHFAKTKMSKHGIQVGEVKMEVPQMIQRKNDIVRQMNMGIAGLFKKNKIDHILGLGSFQQIQGDQKIIEVHGEGSSHVLSAAKIVIATGSEPAELPFLKFDGKNILSSTEILDLQAIPEHLVVIGGGVIGLEMGSVWRRLGAKVTIVEFMEKLLPPADQQIAQEFAKILNRQGFEFKLNTQCLGALIEGNKIKVEVQDRATQAKSVIECDKVLVSTGRRPNTDGLNLTAVGLSTDKGGKIPVNHHFETSVKGIYAIGDVIQGPMLAHKAEEEGVAVSEIMAGKAGHVNYATIPWVIYTWPELAWVGLTEEEAKTKGLNVKTGTFPFLANGRAKAMDETEGFAKVIADAKTDKVLGVHILGPRASDLIAEAVAVMEFGGSAEDIARTCHAHPTLSEAVKEAALGVDGRRINF